MSDLQKKIVWRDKKYTDWVKSLDCCVCGAPADDAHHIIGVGNFGGMGTKAPDMMTMPMCRGHHNDIHTNPDIWGQQWEWAARTLAMAFAEGVLV